eukprot:63035-Chlamydomonas_euryale.AAC.4
MRRTRRERVPAVRPCECARPDAVTVATAGRLVIHTVVHCNWWEGEAANESVSLSVGHRRARCGVAHGAHMSLAARCLDHVQQG